MFGGEGGQDKERGGEGAFSILLHGFLLSGVVVHHGAERCCAGPLEVLLS